jgi:WhiB family transcriptional regulator, redox-sensing transcriptional regulator
VASGPVRRHVHELLAAGLSIKQIAASAGVTRMTVHRIIGRGCGGCQRTRRLRPETASAILAVYLPDHLAEERKPPPKSADDEGDRFGLPAEFTGDRRSLAWKSHGNCATGNYPTRTFFPSRGDRAMLEAAKAICEGCPVQAACLNYALKTDSQGIWGGLTELERQQLKGRRSNRCNGVSQRKEILAGV